MTMTTATLTARAHNGVVPNDDPAARPVRRRFTAAYKLAILEEYERLTDPGAKGALMRREGLYSIHIVEWRRNVRRTGPPATKVPQQAPSRGTCDPACGEMQSANSPVRRARSIRAIRQSDRTGVGQARQRPSPHR